jgi:predicted nucleic acid-binding protein
MLKSYFFLRCPEGRQLRAYDAVQLASALRVHSDLTRTESTSLTFITADERLIAVAQTEGLLTDNPNHHP